MEMSGNVDVGMLVAFNTPVATSHKTSNPAPPPLPSTLSPQRAYIYFTATPPLPPSHHKRFGLPAKPFRFQGLWKKVFY